MYLDFYGFKTEPFHITPDPDFLYLSPSHKEALAAIIYGVEQRKGFITITGEVGLGKTTIVRTFLDRYGSANIKTVLVFNANVSFEGLLKTIYRELGFRPPDLDVYELVHRLHLLLIKEYKNGHNVVLIIDEAQNMPVETLENLRMLSNLESTKDKLLQIILVGQPELERTLALTQLRQLKQRIAIRTKLKPLTPKESLDYIRHRLALVQTRKEPVFTESALKVIVKEAAGIPRRINIICDNALITAFGYGRKKVSAGIVQEVVQDLEGRTPKKRRRKTAVAAALAFVLTLGAAFAVTTYGPEDLKHWIKNRLSFLQSVGFSSGRQAPPQKSAAPSGPAASRSEDANPEASPEEKPASRTPKPIVVKSLPVSTPSSGTDTREASPREHSREPSEESNAPSEAYASPALMHFSAPLSSSILMEPPAPIRPSPPSADEASESPEKAPTEPPPSPNGTKTMTKESTSSSGGPASDNATIAGSETVQSPAQPDPGKLIEQLLRNRSNQP